MNYKESTVNGIQWRRAKSVSVYNPYGGTASIRFDEEDIITFGDNIVRNNVPVDVKPLALDFNPTATIDLLDPTTGVPSGATMTHTDLYIALNSLYMQLANARDNPSPVVTSVITGLPVNP